jgi:hypothetical protein
MSAYNGRRGPNVSQYIANLNTVPSQQELFAAPAANLEEDFSMFTNVDFFDGLDVGTGDIDVSPSLDFDLNVDIPQANQTAGSNAQQKGASKMDFNLNGDFQFADFSNFSAPIVDPSIPNLPAQPTNNFSVPQTYTSPASSAVSPVAQGFDQATDEAVRNAAEEDKRRRNTAASARFRIKKKQREQALEKSAKEMSERVTMLETRIQQLETENTWLKGLITEKNGGKTSSSEIKAMLTKHEQSNAERSTGGRTDGVGTKVDGRKA